MLKKIRLRDFKSFGDAEASLGPLTFLVGANASGKSNLFDAIRFLKGAAFGFTMDEVLDGRRRGGSEIWSGVRGGATGITRLGRPSFALLTTWSIADPKGIPGVGATHERLDVTHEIECRRNGGTKLVREGLRREGHEGYLLETRNVGGRVMETVPTRGHPDGLPIDESFLGQIGRASAAMARGDVDPEVDDLVLTLSQAIAETTSFEPTPSEMRGWGRLDAPLGGQGENFAGILAAHCADPIRKQAIVGWLRELCAPEVADIDFIRQEELQQVTFVLVEQDGGRIPVQNVSDGTLRFLGYIVGLQLIDPGHLVLIEEIDAGLHPTRVRVLVELLEQVTRRGRIQVIATTHSPVVLRWLGEETLRGAIVFGRVPEHDGTIMRRMGDLPRFDEIERREGIDELFMTGWLERAL